MHFVVQILARELDLVPGFTSRIRMVCNTKHS